MYAYACFDTLLEQHLHFGLACERLLLLVVGVSVEWMVLTFLLLLHPQVSTSPSILATLTFIFPESSFFFSFVLITVALDYSILD